MCTCPRGMLFGYGLTVLAVCNIEGNLPVTQHWITRLSFLQIFEMLFVTVSGVRALLIRCEFTLKIAWCFFTLIFKLRIIQLVFQCMYLNTFKVNIVKWHFYFKPRLEKIPHFNQPGSLFEGGVVEYEYSSERYFIFECQHYKGQKCMKHIKWRRWRVCNYYNKTEHYHLQYFWAFPRCKGICAARTVCIGLPKFCMGSQ